MFSQKGNLSVAAAILIGSAIISLSILLSGGIIKIKGFSAKNTDTAVLNVPSAVPVAQPTPQPKAVASTVSIGHLPLKGSKDAKVTLIEYADFRCPFCERFYSQTEKQLLKDYVDTGKVRLAFKQYAFLGPASTLAANASECANEQNKFWELHDYLYTNQPAESDTSMYTVDKLTSIAQGLGINADQFKNCLQTTKYSQNVSADLADGQKAGVSATPSVFVGKTSGDSAVSAVLIEGAQPYPNFQSTIDNLLKQN